MFVVGVLALGLIITLWRYILRTYAYWENAGVPYDPPHIPLGSMKGAMTEVHVCKMMQNVYMKFKNRGPFVGLYFLFRPTVMTTDLAFVKQVLIKDFQQFDDRGTYYNEVDDPVSAHLFSIEAKAWRKLRSKLSPTFTSGKMKFMYPTISEVADGFNSHLTELLNGEHTTVEVKELLGRFTTDIIGTCAFGIECNSLTDPNAQFLKMGRRVFAEPRHSPWFSFLIETYPRIARLFRVRALTNDVSEFFMKLVVDTVEYREKNQIQRNDFMDLLIRLKNSGDDEELTINEIAAQAFVFFLAGFETSSTTMTFGMYELAASPDIQKRARDEVNEVLARHDGKMSYEASMEMKYLDQIINETLRKYPPLPLLVRIPNRPYHVPEYNYTIPTGQPIQIPVYAIHHDPELYPNPSVFDPERFSPDAMRDRNPQAFLAFGDGPRNCIGLRFGMMQTRVGLAMLLKNFDISIGKRTTHPVVLSQKEFILAPEGGMWLDLVKRVDV